MQEIGEEGCIVHKIGDFFAQWMKKKKNNENLKN
jgi:hypothetical protein